MRIIVLTRIQILDESPPRIGINDIIDIPKTTGKAVKRITTLRPMGSLTAHKSNRVQPAINDPAIPMMSLVCNSGLNSGLLVRILKTGGKSNPVAQSASAPIPNQYGIFINSNFVLLVTILVVAPRQNLIAIILSNE